MRQHVITSTLAVVSGWTATVTYYANCMRMR
jgi:hypothetical protein